MGFDVIYLPPIHPIGEVNRKGPNNTLTAGPADPGSPWAIGSKDGGHDAIHPDLGGFEQFDAFVAAAEALGLEVALDLALQAAPDHPWVTEHPEWFTTRVDGTIAYAENPPKKYQDIYPLNFDNDPRGLSEEVLRIVRLWISHGVKIFRVDNPHTKPVWFWEWLIGTVNREHPDVVFLAEAFTRPAMMHALGRAGFQQSYSYFTWRNTKEEIEEYFTEVSHETAAFFRPNFFVNTPDILTEYLQYGGPAAFKIRAVLAATASPLWGVYAGYELYEHVARPGAEEYIDNEKYEYKARDFAAAEAEGRSLAPYLTRLNPIRRAHPALGDLGNLTVHRSTDRPRWCTPNTRRTCPNPTAAGGTPSSSWSMWIRTVRANPRFRWTWPRWGCGTRITTTTARSGWMTCSPGRAGVGASTTTCGWTPTWNRPTSCTSEGAADGQPVSAARSGPGPRPALVPQGRVLRGAGARLRGRQRGRVGRLFRADRET